MIGRVRADLAASLGFFTRVPVGAWAPASASFELSRAAWAFPLVGGLVGLAGGSVYASAIWLRMPPLLGSCWSLAAMLLLTGALHEDGLADLLDGFGGGRDRTRKLEIMRDSRIGGYGALALLLSSLVRVAAVAALTVPTRVLVALIVSGALSRGAIVLLLMLLPPARADGVAASLHPLPRRPALLAGCVAIALDAVLLRPASSLPAALAAVVASLILAAVSHRQIGGQTGDVLGAGAVLAECAVLSVLCAR